MGRKFTIPYALYAARGFVNPFLAEQTGFGDKDLALLWEGLINAFQFDQSAARPAGSMAAQKLVVFEHSSQLGAAPSHKLFDLVSTKRASDSVARSFADYEVSVDSGGVPEGVNVIEMI